MNKRALLLLSLCMLMSGSEAEAAAMNEESSGEGINQSLLKRSKSSDGGIEVMHIGRKERHEEKEDGLRQAKQVHAERAARGQVISRVDQDPKAALGMTWWVGTRLGRINYSFAHPEDPRSSAYLKGQNGRHELGRELKDACDGIMAKDLKIDTLHLCTIGSIVAQGAKQRIVIHPDELQTAYIKLEDVRVECRDNLNKLLEDKIKKFLNEIGILFFTGAKLDQDIVKTQANIVDMCQGLNRQIPGAPDKVKIPTVAEIFAALCIGEGQHVQEGLGLTFALEQAKQLA